MSNEPLPLELDVRMAREEATRAARLVRLVIPTLGLLMLGQAVFYAFAPGTDLALNALAYLPSFGVLGLAYSLIGAGRARAAGWIVVSMLWFLPSSAMLTLGGLSYELGSGQVCAVIAAAAILGPRAALGFCGLSVVFVAAVTSLQMSGKLPEPPVKMTAINAALSLGGSLVIGAALVHFLIRGLRDAMMKALEAQGERDAARIRFLQAQKMEPVGRLASGVAHDFNNLLTVITGVGSLLRAGERDPKFVEELLNDLDSATARATLMTGQLLAFTRNSPVVPEVLDLVALSRQMIPLLSRLIGDDIRVQLDTKADSLRILIDRGQFEQVILNLAVNARDAMSEGGTLTLRLAESADGKRAQIAVKDTGSGIDPSLIDKIFTPFFTTKRTGTGLGLATVRDIVQQHGGSLELDSAPGRGTTVNVSFPLAEHAVPSRESSAAIPLEVRPGRLLLVEDHDLVRRTNRRAFEQAGFEVIAVLDGAEAISLIDGGGHFDVIVTDLMMPRVNGTELGLELEARASQVPVLFVSGNFDHPPPGLAGFSFKSRFLAKPFSLTVLLAAVNELLAEARRQKELDGRQSGDRAS